MALLIYGIILFGSFMLGMYIKFDDVKKAIKNKKHE